jgi:hypothetical protein
MGMGKIHMIAEVKDDDQSEGTDGRGHYEWE